MRRTEETPAQRSLRRGERRFKNNRSTALWNGWLLILASPMLFLAGVGRAIKEDGPILGVLGSLLVCAIFLIPGVLLVRHSGAMRRSTWLENLRFRESNDANAGQPQGPTSSDHASRDS
jgi:hypothetical protein